MAYNVLAVSTLRSSSLRPIIPIVLMWLLKLSHHPVDGNDWQNKYAAIVTNRELSTKLSAGDNSIDYNLPPAQACIIIILGRPLITGKFLGESRS